MGSGYTLWIVSSAGFVRPETNPLRAIRLDHRLQVVFENEKRIKPVYWEVCSILLSSAIFFQCRNWLRETGTHKTLVARSVSEIRRLKAIKAGVHYELDGIMAILAAVQRRQRLTFEESSILRLLDQETIYDR